MMLLSDYIADYLYHYGIHHFFMVSGGGAMYLNNSLGKKIPYTACHHEQACAIAAEGYARVSGNIALVNVTTGPGGLNCLNGLFGQWTDSVPVLYISGQVKRSTMHTFHHSESNTFARLRQLGDQEVDIISIVKPLTKYAICVTDPQQIRYHLEKALWEATSQRTGPVWLDIPFDVQASMIDETNLESFTPPSPYSSETFSIKNVIDTLKNSQRPLIIAGHGIRLSHTKEHLEQLLQITGIPVVTTLNGFDLIEENNPYYIGRIGTIGQRAGNFALQNADCILCLGTRNNIRQISYNWENFAKNAYKIMVDIDNAELQKPLVRPDMPICADLAHFMPALIEGFSSTTIREQQTQWLEFCHSLKRRFSFEHESAYIQKDDSINVYSFIRTLIDSLQEYDICVLANATPTICTFQTGRIKKGQRCFSNSGCASMGYALPASIGAYYASPSKGKIVCIEGDGSIMMNIQELQTIYHYALPIAIFIINNEGYSSIQQTQRNFFDGHLTGADKYSGVSIPDFIEIGKAFGIKTVHIHHPKEVIPKIHETMTAKEPVICNVHVNPHYIFTPKLASRRQEDGTMFSSSLEDMYPFLDKQTIKECMIHE